MKKLVSIVLCCLLILPIFGQAALASSISISDKDVHTESTLKKWILRVTVFGSIGIPTMAM